MRDVAILIPTRGRTDRWPQLVENAQHPDATIYLIVEEDEFRHIAGATVMTRPGGYGKYTAAANDGYRRTREPIIFSAADDLNFHPGWLEAARAKLDDRIRVVGTNDLGNPATLAGESSTHHLIDRRYLDDVGGVFDEGPGSFLHEGYDHNYNDTEFIETAKLRGVWSPCLEAVVEHMHPLWGKGQDDAGYQRSRGSIGGDTDLFTQRRAALWAAAA